MADLVLDAKVLNSGIGYISTNANRIYICTQQPTTYNEATVTYDVGYKDMGVGGVAGAPETTQGRQQVTTNAVTGGLVAVNGTPAAWAVVDTVNSLLLATGVLSGAEALTTDDGWALSPFTIAMGTGATLLEGGCLFHFDGANLSTTLVDTSGNAHVCTAVTGGGIASLDTTVLKFGGASFRLGSTGGDAYELDGSADFAFGTGDFTIDFWIALASTSGTRNLYDSRPTGSTNGPYPVIRNISTTGLEYVVGTAVAITGTGLVFNQWFHIAVTRASGSTRLFLDGVQTGSTYTDSNNYIVGTNRPTCSAFNGRIDELHVVKGRAEWTANFTPPAGPWGSRKEADDVTNAWSAAVVTAGGTVSAGRKTLVSDLIYGLKADYIWYKLDRMWMIAAENEPSAFVDLVTLELAVKTNGQFIVDLGFFSFQRGGAYLTLNYNPATEGVNFTQNSAHMAVWNLHNIGAGNDITMGAWGTSIAMYCHDYDNTFRATINSPSVYIDTPIYDARGFSVANRSASNAQQVYRNGVNLASNSGVSGAVLNSATAMILDYGYFTAASFGGSLNSTEQLAFYNRLLTYMQAVFGVTNIETMSWKREVYRNSGTVSDARKTLVDTLISNLKADGVWNKIDRLWLFAAENVTSALIDIKASRIATVAGGPVFTADRGYLTSATAYINTVAVVPAAGTQATTDSTHIADWVETAATSNSAVLIGNLGTKNTFLWTGASGNYGFVINDNLGTALDSTTPKTNTGFLLGSRTASNVVVLYRNGVSIVSGSNASATPDANANFVGGRNNFGTIDNTAPHRSAAVAYGAGLNATEQLALYNCLRTYMTAVGVS